MVRAADSAAIVSCLRSVAQIIAASRSSGRCAPAQVRDAITVRGTGLSARIWCAILCCVDAPRWRGPSRQGDVRRTVSAPHLEPDHRVRRRLILPAGQECLRHVAVERGAELQDRRLTPELRFAAARPAAPSLREKRRGDRRRAVRAPPGSRPRSACGGAMSCSVASSGSLRRSRGKRTTLPAPGTVSRLIRDPPQRAGIARAADSAGY